MKLETYLRILLKTRSRLLRFIYILSPCCDLYFRHRSTAI